MVTQYSVSDTSKKTSVLLLKKIRHQLNEVTLCLIQAISRMCICPSPCAQPSIHFSVCTQCTYVNNGCTPSGSKPSKNLNISLDCSQNCHLRAKKQVSVASGIQAMH